MLIPSTMLPLGTKAPDFSLPDVVSGEQISLDSFKEKQALLVIFLCRHCPYVQHVKQVFSEIGRDYKDIGIVAVSSNDAQAYPEDAPESLKEFALQEGFTFPLCYDESQEVAKAYTAACTPDVFLFDEQSRLVYRGQVDDSRPGKVWVKPSGKDVRAAIDAVLSGSPVDPNQKPSLGCNIKWKPGNAPSYFKR